MTPVYSRSLDEMFSFPFEELPQCGNSSNGKENISSNDTLPTLIRVVGKVQPHE